MDEIALDPVEVELDENEVPPTKFEVFSAFREDCLMTLNVDLHVCVWMAMLSFVQT